MKQQIALVLILSSTLVKAQTNISWEKTDSTLTKTKAQLYSDTKLFIAKSWKSSKDVIQNDDKDAGIILLKGMVSESESFMLNTYTYNYNYTATFRMKDGKVKIVIDNVYCESAHISNGTPIAKIDPFEGNNCPETGTLKAPGLPRKRAISMMVSLRKDIQAITDSYIQYIKSAGSGNNDW